jgi:hypothetical protein
MLEIFSIPTLRVIILQKVARLKDRLMNTMYHHGGTPPEGPNVYKLGRRAADYVYTMTSHSFSRRSMNLLPQKRRDYIEGQDVVALEAKPYLSDSTGCARTHPTLWKPERTKNFRRSFLRDSLNPNWNPPPQPKIRDKAQKFKDRKQQAKNMRTSVVKCCLKSEYEHMSFFQNQRPRGV